jgi:hypothetical protein
MCQSNVHLPIVLPPTMENDDSASSTDTVAVVDSAAADANAKKVSSIPLEKKPASDA